MKIFSWVHRRFHQKGVADEAAKNADNDKVTLLENEALASVCDGSWKEGILAIGTFGIDLSKDFQAKDVAYAKNQVLFVGNEDDEEDQEQEMKCPLVLNACKHGFDHVQKQDPSPREKVAKLNNGKEDVGAKDLKVLDIEGTEKNEVRNSGERTTLADLLWGDSEKNLLNNKKLCDDRFKVTDHVSTGTESIKSSLISKKNKKLEKDDSTHPIKKTKRLIRKMLKKKIYPDIGNQKKETEGIICHGRHVHAT
ncbi:hypothetical protein L1887_33957 [Cichorium endivia]|nr:hypothetical protein L1887_33957 [Cichorium endivia]